MYKKYAAALEAKLEKEPKNKVEKNWKTIQEQIKEAKRQISLEPSILCL